MCGSGRPGTPHLYRCVVPDDGERRGRTNARLPTTGNAAVIQVRGSRQPGSPHLYNCAAAIGRRPSLTVQAGRIQLLPEEPKFVLTRSPGFPDLLRSTKCPANSGLHLVCPHAWMEGGQLHLPIRVVEVEKRHVRNDEFRSAALGARLAP